MVNDKGTFGRSGIDWCDPALPKADDALEIGFAFVEVS